MAKKEKIENVDITALKHKYFLLKMKLKSTSIEDSKEFFNAVNEMKKIKKSVVKNFFKKKLEN